MKPYLTAEECQSIINLIDSPDKENYILGLNILVSKSFKTTSSELKISSNTYLMIFLIHLNHLKLLQVLEQQYIMPKLC